MGFQCCSIFLVEDCWVGSDGKDAWSLLLFGLSFCMFFLGGVFSFIAV